MKKKILIGLISLLTVNHFTQISYAITPDESGKAKKAVFDNVSALTYVYDDYEDAQTENKRQDILKKIDTSEINNNLIILLQGLDALPSDELDKEDVVSDTQYALNQLGNSLNEFKIIQFKSVVLDKLQPAIDELKDELAKGKLQLDTDVFNPIAEFYAQYVYMDLITQFLIEAKEKTGKDELGALNLSYQDKILAYIPDNINEQINETVNGILKKNGLEERAFGAILAETIDNLETAFEDETFITALSDSYWDYANMVYQILNLNDPLDKKDERLARLQNIDTEVTNLNNKLMGIAEIKQYIDDHEVLTNTPLLEVFDETIQELTPVEPVDLDASLQKFSVELMTLNNQIP